MKKNHTVVRIINTVWVTACGIVFLMPLLWMLSSSVKLGHEVFAADFKWIPDVIQWGNYVQVWTHEKVPFWNLYLNSLTIAVVGTVGELIIASMAGYSLSKINYKGRDLIFVLMLITMMIPGQATIIPKFVLFDWMGLYNNLWALILPAWFNVTSIFLLKQFYAGLPNELMEAAKIDGANHFQIWWRIMLPLTKPAMVTAAVLAFINSWNEYMSALVFLPTSENYTVSQGIQFWMAMSDEHNLMMTAAASAIVPVIILFLFTQKYFVESIATTGVKGWAMETLFRGNTLLAPKLIAHRGFAVSAPQNSIPAFEAAGRLGFWAIETDVRRTADGVLVCCHDATVDSMFEGTGAVCEMTLAQLRKLEFKPEKRKGCTICGPMPTFREYLAVCREYGAIPFIETKTADIGDVLEAAGEFFREEEIVVSSVQFAHLEKVRGITDKVFIHHIFSDAEKMRKLSEMGHSGLSYNYPNYRECPKELLDTTHAAGVQICLRAGDTAQAVRDMIALGLDYIPTNCINAI